MSVLVKVDTKAPTPVMHRDAAAAFAKLRNIVLLGSGVDFLARCGDMSRPAGFVSKKDGVANRSWHKTGRAFDYDQESKAILIEHDPSGGRQYFRTYLICAVQDGSLGEKRTVRDTRGFRKTCFVFDFTKAAEALNFKRIPAWNGWGTHYNRREFWHYQFNPDGLTWDAAMRQVTGNREQGTGKTDSSPVTRHPSPVTILGVNDRGDAVTRLQTELVNRGFLAAKEIDGIFGGKTLAAVKAFQKRKGLSADGLAGPDTLKALNLEI